MIQILKKKMYNGWIKLSEEKKLSPKKIYFLCLKLNSSKIKLFNNLIYLKLKCNKLNNNYNQIMENKL